MQFIQNEKTLYQYHGQYNSFRISLSALKEAINAVDPSILIKKAIEIKNNKEIIITDVNGNKSIFNLNHYESFHIVGAGKATARMAKTLMEILNLEFSSGAIIIPYHEKVIPDKLIVIEAGHPIPDQNSIIGTKTIIDLLERIVTKSLVFVLISGGASSLMCQPLDNLSLTAKQVITQQLLKSGASIHEINIVRKHLSKIKGGQLPKYLRKGHIITLILSDVVNDDLNIIGSGPTVGDNSTFANAINILKKYNIWNFDEKNAIDILNIKKILQDGRNGILEETPRIENKIFKRVHNILIGNNEIACRNAMNVLLEFGIRTKYLGSKINLEAKVFGKKIAELLNSTQINSFEDISFGNDKSFAYVLGGETVVNLNLTDGYKNSIIGKGGRNQETIVSSIQNLQNYKWLKDFTIICCGTDGIDGNSESAGGLVSPFTLHSIEKDKLNINQYLDSHDSGTLLKKLRSQIITGRTGTNVNDIAIICYTN
jgi:glycerate 2-kinase